jgi:2-dehydro-3-deoxyphosphogluconate aldolase/(4S)-4-hydroxy-2-oxoglutarate aldolase
MDMLSAISRRGIVPVIKLSRPEDAVPLCGALARGGLPVAEITFRTAAAEESIRRVHAELPNVLLGAGTVLTTDQADRAAKAGAAYIVTPGLNPAVVRHCVERGLPVLPGCACPSDIERALDLGLTAVKFFPAEAIGGLNAIKAMSAPYGAVSFVPTGGIDEKKLPNYLAFEKVLACGGSWMVKEAWVDAGDFAAVERATRAAVDAMLGFSLGLDAAVSLARGETIMIATHSPTRAAFYLEERGIGTGNGKIRLIQK